MAYLRNFNSTKHENTYSFNFHFSTNRNVDIPEFKKMILKNFAISNLSISIQIVPDSIGLPSGYGVEGEISNSVESKYLVEKIIDIFGALPTHEPTLERV